MPSNKIAMTSPDLSRRTKLSQALIQLCPRADSGDIMVISFDGYAGNTTKQFMWAYSISGGRVKTRDNREVGSCICRIASE